MSRLPWYAQTCGIINLSNSPVTLFNHVNIQGIAKLHSTVPVAPITTKLDLIPQDLTTEGVTSWYHEFFMGLTCLVGAYDLQTPGPEWWEVLSVLIKGTKRKTSQMLTSIL